MTGAPPGRGQSSNRPRVAGGPVDLPGQPRARGACVPYAYGDRRVGDLDDDVDVAMTLSGAFGDEFAEDQGGIVDDTVGQSGLVAQCVDAPSCASRRELR